MALPIADAGADQTFTFASLPIASVSLTGSGTPGTGGSSITAYQWTLLEKPPGSLASLSSTTAQNPTLDDVDTWGNYRLLLVVTDDLSAVSESDLEQAPNSAFVLVRIQGQYASLQKIAPGERDWEALYWALVTEVETQRNEQDTHTIASHADTTATGAELETLTDGSNADALHSHGSLADRIWLTGMAQGSVTELGYEPGLISTQDWSGIEQSEAHLAWRLPESITVEEFEVLFLDGGAASGRYTVRLYEMTVAQWKANDFAGATQIGAAVQITQGGTDNEPMNGGTSALAYAASVGNILAARVTEQNANGLGGGLCVTIGARK